MSNPYQTFDERLKRIDRKRARLSNGYSAKVTNEGLIVFRPKRRRATFSVRGLILLIVGFFLFKGLILAHLGGTVYDLRVDALQQGSFVEQTGAIIMAKDQITVAIAEVLRPFVAR
ncbi:MAG: hypothetical protein AAF686_05490 [Pseudomonadota bacterium]